MGNFTRRASLGMVVGAATGANVSKPAHALHAASERGAGVLQVAGREDLSRVDRRQEIAFLIERGREGFFRWESGNFVEAIENDREQAIHVPQHDDPTGADGVWKRVVEDGVRLAWFGAKFDVGRVNAIDRASDDSSAWEAALIYLNYIGGGTLYLPQGASKVTRELTIGYDAIRIVGTGTRKVYPGKFSVGKMGPSTLVPVHKGRSAFRFIAPRPGSGSFCAENFNLATLEDRNRPEAAFCWETHRAFLYGFTFRRIGVHGFTSAFDSYKGEGAENAVGAVLIEDCVINRNQWIVRTLNGTQLNGFRFVSNKAGQNGYQPGEGGIAISGHDITIEGNILEGMRDPVTIQGSYRDVQVRGNYFEANVGTACIQLRDILGPYSVGPNNYGMLNYENIDHKVLLKFCGLGECLDPYWPYVVHKLPAPLMGSVPACSLKNRVRSNEYGFCRLDRLNNPIEAAFADATRIWPDSASSADRNRKRGDSVQIYHTSGVGWAAHQYTIEGAAGEWAVMSWLFQRQPDQFSPANPYVSIKVNNGDSGGSRDYVAYGFTQAWRDGEWCLMTAAIRLEVAMSALQILLYPHGMNPNKGRTTRYTIPLVYTVSDISDVAISPNRLNLGEYR